jgi:hypothetical protein
MQDTSRAEIMYRLPGEPDDSREFDEVEHWRVVYREVVTTFDELLGQLPAHHLDEMLGDQQLRIRRHELAQRLAHWNERSQDLGLP